MAARRKPTTAPTAPTSAVIYLRVSTEEQARSGLGREAQEAKCRAFCERAGYTVAAVYVDDGISAKAKGLGKRAGLAAAVAQVKATPGAVMIIYALSRAFRTQKECWNTVDVDGDILPMISATEAFDLTTSFGRAALGMLVTFATLEGDLASDRTRDALAAAKARGQRLGAPRTVDRAPETAARVRELYAAGGYTHRSLAERLNADGVLTPTGSGRWWPTMVARVLKQEASAQDPAS